MAQLKEIIKKVESSKAFKSFRRQHPDYFLAHCFVMLSEGQKDYDWQLGYYSESTDKVVVFETLPKINMLPEEDAFKKEGIIKRLEIGKVKLSVGKALGICDELVSSKYPNRTVTKRIIILQHLERQVFNITLVTLSFDILNIRIDAATGEVLSDNIQSIMSLGKVRK